MKQLIFDQLNKFEKIEKALNSDKTSFLEFVDVFFLLEIEDKELFILMKMGFIPFYYDCIGYPRFDRKELHSFVRGRIRQLRAKLIKLLYEGEKVLFED